MTDAPYMPFWIGDFVSDTTHLTAEETGAYLMLLGAMWLRAGVLPGGDEKGLCRMARVGASRWSRVWSILEPFFTVLPNGDITQKRLAEELKRTSGIQEANSRKVKLGWETRRKRNNELADGDHVVTNVSHTHTHIHKESKSIREGASAPEKRAPQRKLIKEALMASLDAAHADAVIEHRLTLRKPLSLKAAQLLSARFREAPDPNAAADEMIANGWVGFKFQWMLNNRNQRAKQMSRTQRASMEILEEIETRGNVVQFGLSRRALCGPSDQRAPGELRAATSLRAGISDNSDRPLSEPGGHTIDHASDD